MPPHEERCKKLNISIPYKVYDKLEQRAKLENCSKSYLITRYINKELRELEKELQGLRASTPASQAALTAPTTNEEVNL
jgi:hypothetical protein